MNIVLKRSSHCLVSEITLVRTLNDVKSFEDLCTDNCIVIDCIQDKRVCIKSLGSTSTNQIVGGFDNTEHANETGIKTAEDDDEASFSDSTTDGNDGAARTSDNAPYDQATSIKGSLTEEQAHERLLPFLGFPARNNDDDDMNEEPPQNEATHSQEDVTVNVMDTALRIFNQTRDDNGRKTVTIKRQSEEIEHLRCEVKNLNEACKIKDDEISRLKNTIKAKDGDIIRFQSALKSVKAAVGQIA